MDAEGPGVAVGLDHLRLPGEVLCLVLHVPATHFGLEVAGVFDAVGWVHIDHLDLSGQGLASGQRRHNSEGITKDHPVGPVHRVFVELDRLAVFMLRFRKEVPLDVLPPGDLKDRLGGDALVDVEGHGIGDAPLLLPLPRPLQPRLVIPEGLLETLDFCRFQLARSCHGDEVGNLIGPAGPVETQHRGEMRIVSPLDPLFFGDLPPGLQPRRWDVQPLA